MSKILTVVPKIRGILQERRLMINVSKFCPKTLNILFKNLIHKNLVSEIIFFKFAMEEFE